MAPPGHTQARLGLGWTGGRAGLAGLGAVQGREPTPARRPAAAGVPAGAHPAAPPLPTPPEPASRGGRARRTTPRFASLCLASPGAGCRCPARWPRWPASSRTAAASPRRPRPQRPWRRAGRRCWRPRGGANGLKTGTKDARERGAARAADRRNTPALLGRTSGCPARAACRVSGAEGAELSYNLFAALPRACELNDDPRSTAVIGPPGRPAPPSPRPRANCHASPPRGPAPAGPARPASREQSGAERRVGGNERAQSRRAAESSGPEQDPRDRAAEPGEPSGAERSRAEPSRTERGGAQGRPP